MIFSNLSNVSFSIDINLDQPIALIDALNIIFQIIPILLCVTAFITMAIFWIKFIIKTWFDFSSLYDLYIIPYLCDMMYKRLKSEGFNPLKIPFDDL